MALILLGAVSVASAIMLGGKMRAALLAVGVILLAAAVLLLAVGAKKAPEPVDGRYGYAAKKRLMTEPEQALYNILLRSGKYCVFPQVSLAAIVDKTSGGAYRNELFRTVDFVICALQGSRPLLVVELNDASHKRSERVLRDEKVRCILDRAGLPLLTLQIEDLRDERGVLKRVETERLR